ncbi:MAG: hypothetical protein NDJ92_02400 [Thermoanaerobaculia bacterium]|nr:hypothetical protein [Thermoanaerobaculia bacterium]
MRESSEIATAHEQAPLPARAPTEFSGIFDEHVVHDVHHLFRKKTKQREVIMLVGGLAGVGLGTFTAVISRGNTRLLIETLRSFMWGLALLSGWWSMQKGWARFMLDQVVTGRVHGVGIIVDQLDDRATWDEFCSARLSNSAALLFVDEKERTPQVLAFDGLPLHRSFFESEEDWHEVSELIRERVRNVSLVAGG